MSSLKTQKKGSAITANLDIKLSSDLSVEEATKISNNLREKLIKLFNNLGIKNNSNFLIELAKKINENKDISEKNV